MPETVTEGYQHQSLLMTAGEINMDTRREAHPLKSIGCFIKKPITIDALLQRIKAELE